MSVATIPLPPGYRADLVLRYLGRDSDSLCERVDGSTISRALVLNDRPQVVTIALQKDRALCSSAEAVPQVRRLLGLTTEVEDFEHAFPELIEGHEGARIPQTATVYESLLWAIVGQQVNLPFAYRLRRVVVELCGLPAPGGFRAHPAAEEVAKLEAADLTSRQFSRSKAQYVIDSARLIAAGDLALESLREQPFDEVERQLLAVRGIGAWTANYVMMRGCGFPDCAPAGDSALSASLRSHFALDHRIDAKETIALMERYRPWRSLATFHFWLRFAARQKPHPPGTG